MSSDFWLLVIYSVCVSVGIVLLVLAYRRLLKRMKRGKIEHQEYLYIDANFDKAVSGNVTFAVSAENKKYDVVVELIDQNFEKVKEIERFTTKLGANPIDFDTEGHQNGSYFIRVTSSNQKITKRIKIEN